MRIPEGIRGLHPTNVLIGPTEDPNGKYDAEGYGLLYLDENNSAEITNGGLGFDLNSDSIYSFGITIPPMKLLRLINLGQMLHPLRNNGVENWLRSTINLNKMQSRMNF